MSSWNGKILVVDDNSLDFERVERTLERLKFDGDLLWAKDGIEALEMLRRMPSSDRPLVTIVTLVDLNMPRLNGIELIREIRRDPMLCAVPVHVLTTSHHTEDVAEAWYSSISGYHVKPIKLRELEALLKLLIEYWEQNEFYGLPADGVGEPTTSTTP